jgi:hypothetical protein
MTLPVRAWQREQKHPAKTGNHPTAQRLGATQHIVGNQFPIPISCGKSQDIAEICCRRPAICYLERFGKQPEK